MLDLNQPENAFLLSVTREASALAQQVKAGMAMMNLTKSDFSPVTVGDYAIQALVARRLEEQLGGPALVGEERAEALRAPEQGEMRQVVAEFVGKFCAGATEDTVCEWIDRGAAEPAGVYWILDPIDGTKGYVRGGQYAVALARIAEGQVTHAALGCPNLPVSALPEMGEGAVALAQRDAGAYISPLDQDEFHHLQVSTYSDPSDARFLRSYESSHTNAGQIDEVAARMGTVAEPVRMDSQAKFAVLAAGRGDVLFRLLSADRPDYKECAWDLAAGSLVLEEAGGRITDLSGKPLDFTAGRRLTNNRGVVASNGVLHESALEALAAVGAASA